ncbi:glycosyltransferase family 2 protein [Nakamurella sp.]|uniref:glycosyltransferase family 2 protein n=1 Tax=Nakamurella sp. TaxID=1869182 RepID=UPI0037833915
MTGDVDAPTQAIPTNPAGPKRQRGSDIRDKPLPPVAPPASDGLIAIGRIAIIFTILAWLAYVFGYFITGIINSSYQNNIDFLVETIVYVGITSVLALSALLYLVARQGALYRSRAHRRVPRAVIDGFFDTTLPTMTVLVPSYREEIAVVRKTLLSALLQEYPFLRVVLLLDDPPNPTSAANKALLEGARRLPAELEEWLNEPRERFARTLEHFEMSELEDPEPGQVLAQMRALAAEFGWAVDWLRVRMDEELIEDHVDKFFAEQVLGALADDFAAVGAALTAAAAEESPLPRARMLQLHRRLAWTFRGEVTSFERKLYSSLSQEANKAMNLNSYIGLMGHSFEVQDTPRGQVLSAAGASGSLVIPDADFILTLDADSIVLPEYCLRLVYVMCQPENAKLAVIQTPYSAFPGSPTRMERLSGATTDLQHIVHQGMSYYGATFWVGANAVIRKRALDDIVEIEHQGGFEIRRYVMDRTVIEDTESSVDLAIHGWWLLNYPERLSYSATPPDFGSLCIQRRRWANGGLIIMPKLWTLRQSRSKRAQNNRAIETLLRVNYLASTCWSSFALVLLLVYPFNNRLLSPLVLLAALPYFAAMSSDLKRCGYKRMDIFRVYGFNLILLPVNLAGVFKSMQQAITGRRIPFARTPKVANRTATPLLFAFSPFLIIGWSVWTAWRGYVNGFWGNFVFGAFNASTAAYALVALVGVRFALVDVWLGFVERLYVSDKPREVVRVRRRRAAPEPVSPGWRDVLYQGAPATATGEYVSESAGMFRILADVPEAPVNYGRRASDRAPQGYGRRATDRVDGPADGAGRREGDQVNAGRRASDQVNFGRRAGDQAGFDRRAGDRAGDATGRRESDQGGSGRRGSDQRGRADGERAVDQS